MDTKLTQFNRYFKNIYINGQLKNVIIQFRITTFHIELLHILENQVLKRYIIVALKTNLDFEKTRKITFCTVL